MQITREEFKAYVEVQLSGVTNMWHTRYVSKYSGLEEHRILEIIRSYGKLDKKYLGVKADVRDGLALVEAM